MKLYISAVLAFSAVCLADSAVMFEFPDGRSVGMTTSGEIAMAAESVFITPSGSMFRAYGDDLFPMMDVRCVFELVNLTDRYRYITVGFPLDAKFGDSYTAMSEADVIELLQESTAGEDRPPWWQVDMVSGMDASDRIPDSLDFRTFVNGQELPVHYRTCAHSLEEQLVWQPVVAVWKMGFQPEETVMLENTYNTSWDFFGGGPWSDFSVNYILTTGGTWAGPIGDALIILEIPEELPSPHLSDTLAVFWEWTGSPVIEGRTVTWHYQDLEPDENLTFSICTEELLTHWDESIDVSSLISATEWEEETLLSSADRFLRDNSAWGCRYDALTMLRILEAALYYDSGLEPPSDVPLEGFTRRSADPEGYLTTSRLEMVELVRNVTSDMERLRETAASAGYLEFLPLMTHKYSFEEGHLDMFAAMPGREERFLELMLNLEAARTGAEITDPEVEAFYLLTGWYHPGEESGQPSLSRETVEQYRNAAI